MCNSNNTVYVELNVVKVLLVHDALTNMLTNWNWL